MADKHILGAGGLHPPGTGHPHQLSRVGMLMAGYTRQVWRVGTHALHVGGDATVYRVPSDLTESYGSPLSFHLYARWTLAIR
jgi:hypothetical protein